MSLRVVQYGLGPIGIETARIVLEKSGHLELVGAIDIDPAKVGQDVGVLLGGDPIGVTVSADARTTLTETQPDVALHTTSSFLDVIGDQLRLCAELGVNVVSSAEELSYPYQRHPALCAELDALAKASGATLLGAGVNPGYVMDTLATMATGVCKDVERMHITRIVDASKRRLPLQRKVGAGLTVAEFEAKKATGRFGHIGLRESLWFVAESLGWPLDADGIHEQLDPVVAEEKVVTPYLTAEAGQVAGIHHWIVGRVQGEPVLRLDLKMYVGAKDPRDAVKVTGNPPVDLVVRDGIFGDTATCAVLINAVPLVHAAAGGLKTMQDLPILRAFGTTPT